MWGGKAGYTFCWAKRMTYACLGLWGTLMPQCPNPAWKCNSWVGQASTTPKPRMIRHPLFPAIQGVPVTQAPLLLFCCCDRIPWQRQHRGERVYFPSQFHVTIYPCGEVKVAELKQLVLLQQQSKPLINACTLALIEMSPFSHSSGPPVQSTLSLTTHWSSHRLTQSRPARCPGGSTHCHSDSQR